MKTQRNFIVATAKQTIKMKNITQIGNIIDIVKEYVDTNLDFDYIKDYIPYAIQMDINNIKTAQLPGRAEYLGYLSFFLCDEKETKELVNELFFNVPSTDNEETSQNNVTNTDS